MNVIRLAFFLVLSLVFLAGLAVGSCARAAEVEAFAKAGHDSHIARGCPRRCDQTERSVHKLMGGATITAGKRRAWEIDLAHGLIWINDAARDTASSVDARFYPGRLR